MSGAVQISGWAAACKDSLISSVPATHQRKAKSKLTVAVKIEMISTAFRKLKCLLVL